MRQSKGAMQREAKAAALKYTEADMQNAILQARIEQLKEIDRRYTNELDKRFHRQSVLDALSLLTAAACDVLVSDFGWAPYRDERSRIAKFASRLGEIINEKSDGDLNEYARDVLERTGIGFDTLEDE